MTAYDTDSDLVYSEKTATFSQWVNNNNETATFRLLTHEKRKGLPARNNAHIDSGKCDASTFLKVVVKPGEKVSLPAEYDQAIRKIDARTGQVVGGLCPWLTKIGEEDVVINKSLDYKTAILHEDALRTVEVMKKEQELRDALQLMEQQREAAKIAASTALASSLKKK